jgi:succinoglycan biosynthesis transport protein ExoP
MSVLTVAPPSPNVLGYRLPDDTAEQIPAARLASVLRRQKWLLLAILVCVMPPAVFVIETLRPYYDAEALLMINTRNAEFRDLQATVATTDADAVAIGTQVGIIRSVEMAGRVVDRLKLAQNPEFTRVLDAPPSFIATWTSKILTWFGVATKRAAPLSAGGQ